jgi:hypothetical protein
MRVKTAVPYQTMRRTPRESHLTPLHFEYVDAGQGDPYGRVGEAPSPPTNDSFLTSLIQPRDQPDPERAKLGLAVAFLPTTTRLFLQRPDDQICWRVFRGMVKYLLIFCLRPTDSPVGFFGFVSRF